MVKILDGLIYLHDRDVVHCDLKAANILTTKDGKVKLTDFGVSMNLRALETSGMSQVNGSPNWSMSRTTACENPLTLSSTVAPEVIELKGASRASDIWSLGCTIVELLTSGPPHAEIRNSLSGLWRASSFVTY